MVKSFLNLEERATKIILFLNYGKLLELEITLQMRMKINSTSPQFQNIHRHLRLLAFLYHLRSYNDRPTELADEQAGICDWLSMFGKQFFNGIPEKESIYNQRRGSE